MEKKDNLGVIYVILKKYKNETIKIGSTKNFLKRMCNYITPECDFDNNSHKIWMFIIKNFKYDCYIIDKIIKYCSKKYSIPYKYYNGSGGNEHYEFNDDISNIINFFNIIGIEIIEKKNYEVDVDELREEIIKKNYEDIGSYYDKEEKIKKNTKIDDIIKQSLENIIVPQEYENILVQLRDYQLDVMEKLKEIYNENDKFKLIWSCGLGKTLFSIYISKVFNHKKIIIGVPSLYLQKQFYKEIIRIFPNKKNILCIGCDNNSTINIKEIKAHYNKNKNEPIFIITTYSSCHLIDDTFEFDFKIGDEAHHLVGEENKKTKNYKLFHNIKSNKSLFMTATEKVTNMKSNKEVYSMDNNNIFGDYLDVKSVKWAIDNKKITDFILLVLSNTEDEVDKIIKKLKIEIKHKELFISAYITLKAINNYCIIDHTKLDENNHYRKLTHVLICCNKIENANIISEYINTLLKKNIFKNIKQNEFYNESLHTEKANLNFNDEVDNFKNSKYGIISSVYIFSEGFDLPKLNGVVFAENMMSDIRIVQTALRPNRIDPNDDKKKSYIIIPYMISNDILANNASFNKIRMIISKLRNVDETIEHKIVIKSGKYIEPDSDTDTENDSDTEDKKKHNFDFNDENKDLDKIKLRLILSKALSSKNTEEQDEMNYVRAVNRDLNIKSKEIYTTDEIKQKHENYIENPEEYFRAKGVWINWSYFLGYDTSKFIKTKNEWIIFCREKNITSLKEYEELSKKYDCLPHNPVDYYEDFTNIQNELKLNKKRR